MVNSEQQMNLKTNNVSGRQDVDNFQQNESEEKGDEQSGEGKI